MTAIGFVKRASLETVVVVSVLALAAGFVFGQSAGLGVLAGGSLAVANLWSLARRAVAATDGPSVKWSLGAVLRLGGVAAAVALVLASGSAHPVAIVAGLTVLPCVIVARGLAAAEEA
jgi:hypothetical protein